MKHIPNKSTSLPPQSQKGMKKRSLKPMSLSLDGSFLIFGTSSLNGGWNICFLEKNWHIKKRSISIR